MGKSKKNKINKSDNQTDTAGQNSSKTTQKRDGKRLKNEKDHLEHIPFRLREIMKSKDKIKAGSSRAKKLKKDPSSHFKPYDASGVDLPVLQFSRKTHESEGAYVRRMEDETKYVLFLSKNQVDRKPELAADKQEKPAGKDKSEKKKEYAKMRHNKLQQKKLDRREDKTEKEMFVDNVPFGEVAMAPPSLSAKPKKAQVKSKTAPKELLLHSLLGHATASTAKPSMARQRLVEEERQRVVEAYRQLKKQQQQNKTASLPKLSNSKKFRKTLKSRSSAGSDVQTR